MRRKDWISLIALLVIMAIAALGECISVQGDIALALGNLWYFIPMIILLVCAVILGHRKGNHASLFKWLSWCSFGLSMVFLYLSMASFMHFFSVQDSSLEDTLKKNTELAKTDMNSMLEAYEKGVYERSGTYQEKLSTAIADGDENLLKSVAPRQSNWSNDDAIKFTQYWQEDMLSTHQGVKNSYDSISPIIQQSIVTNFDIFTAQGHFNALKELYNTHKAPLLEQYSHRNKYEEARYLQFSLRYPNNESEWMGTGDLLTYKRFSLVGFLIFIILAFLTAIAFLFIKDESIRKPKMRTNVQAVYEAGHKLRTLD